MTKQETNSNEKPTCCYYRSPAIPDLKSNLLRAVSGLKERNKTPGIDHFDKNHRHISEIIAKIRQ